MADQQVIKVALIEDDHMLSDMYKIKFEKEGFAIATAADGAEGLEVVEKEQPDIILLDVIMPRMDGFQTLQELRARGIRTPVILLTNLGQEEDIKKGEFPQEQVLVIDSLTSMTEHMKRLIAHIQGKAHFTYDEWAIVLSNLEEYFYTMKGLLETASVTYPESINELTGEKIPGSVIPGHPGFKHIIIIAHETTERDETTGKVQTLPFIEGQMRHKVGKYFEEVYHCQVEVPKTGKPIYKVLTVSTDRYSARTSRELPVFVSSDFSVILGKAEGKAKGEALDPIQVKVEAAKKAKEGKK